MNTKKGAINKTLLTIIAIVVIVGGWLVGQYNGLVVKEENVKTAWSNVETQYQRRFDLIPGLVEAVKGSMNQEQEVFDQIAEARTRYSGAQASGNIGDQVEATQGLNSALGRLLAVMENYPDLKSSERVADFMVQLEGTENRISTERTRYNEVANIYNKQIRVFPTVMLAGIFGFMEYDRFESQEGSENRVDFDLTVDNDEE